MWLSIFLASARSVPGRQWIGKVRKVKKVTIHQKRRQRAKEEHVEKMSQLLSKPYLTMEEEKYQLLAKERRSQYIPKWIRQRKNNWLKRDNNITTLF